MPPYGAFEPDISFREGRVSHQKPRKMLVWRITLPKEQAVILIVANVPDTAVERFGALLGKLKGKAPTHQLRVANVASKLPRKEALDGKHLANDVTPIERILASHPDI